MEIRLSCLSREKFTQINWENTTAVGPYKKWKKKKFTKRLRRILRAYISCLEWFIIKLYTWFTVFGMLSDICPRPTDKTLRVRFSSFYLLILVFLEIRAYGPGGITALEIIAGAYTEMFPMIMPRSDAVNCRKKNRFLKSTNYWPRNCAENTNRIIRPIKSIGSTRRPRGVRRLINTNAGCRKHRNIVGWTHEQ